LLPAVLFLCHCAPITDRDADEMRAHELSIAVGPGRTFAAWHGGFGKGSSIYIQEIDTRGSFKASPIRVSEGNLLAYEPDLVIAGTHPVIAWYEKDPADGRLSAWLAGLTSEGNRQWVVRLGDRESSSRNPVVRVIGDKLHVAWIEQALRDNGDNQSSIRHQVFTLSGKALAPAHEIGRANRDTWNLNATTSGNRFIVAYDAALSTQAHELHMLVVSGQDVLHRSLSGNDGYASLYPDLQVNASGRAALTWFDERDGNQEVYLLAAPLDTFVTGALPPPERISHSDEASIGAYLSWNGEVIGLAWSDEEAGQRQIFTRTFEANGTPLGPVRHFAPVEGSASVPAIRARGADFLLAWNDYVIASGSVHSDVKASHARIAMLPVSD